MKPATPTQRPAAKQAKLEPEPFVINVRPNMFLSHPLGVFVLSGMTFLFVIGGAVQLFSKDGEFPYSALLVMGLFWTWHIAESLSTRLTVTRSRATLHKGIVSRKQTEVRHRDVRSIDVSQGLFQRFFNVGNIAISTASTGGKEIEIKGVDSPHLIAGQIRAFQDD